MLRALMFSIVLTSRSIDELYFTSVISHLVFELRSSILLRISGTFSTNMLTATQSATYLRTLPSIRERCNRVHELAKQGLLKHFDYVPQREEQVIRYCIDIIRVSSSRLASDSYNDRNSYVSATLV